MFRKDAKAEEQWSPELVRMCAARQKRILADAWPSLRKEACWSQHLHLRGVRERRQSRMDGAGAGRGHRDAGGRISRNTGSGLRGAVRCSGPGRSPGGAVGRSPGQELRDAVPARAGLDSLKPLRKRNRQGEMKGRDFVPSADWALSIKYERGSYPEAGLDKPSALKYLHRDTLVLPDAPPGPCARHLPRVPLDS